MADPDSGRAGNYAAPSIPATKPAPYKDPASSPTAGSGTATDVNRLAEQAAEWKRANPGKDWKQMPGYLNMPFGVVAGAEGIVSAEEAAGRPKGQVQTANMLAEKVYGGQPAIGGHNLSPTAIATRAEFPAMQLPYQPEQLIVPTIPVSQPKGAAPVAPGPTVPTAEGLKTQAAGIMGSPASVGPSVADRTSGAIDFLGKQGGLGGALAGLAGGIMDAIGSGRLAYAGRDATTRLQKEYQMRLASQQQANQIYASMDAELKKLPAQADQAIRTAMAQGDIDAAKEIAVAHGNYALTYQLEQLKNYITYANAQTALPNIGDPFAAGAAALNAPSAGGPKG